MGSWMVSLHIVAGRLYLKNSITQWKWSQGIYAGTFVLPSELGALVAPYDMEV